MAKQLVTVRLDEDDIAFLSALDMPGASNLSEKLRALIAEARSQSERLNEYTPALDFSNKLFARSLRSVQSAEQHTGLHSEFLTRVIGWLPDAVALTVSECQDVLDPPTHTRQALKLAEQRIAERVMSLVTSTHSLALSDWAGCYDPAGMAERARPHLQAWTRLARLVELEPPTSSRQPAASTGATS